MAPKGKATGLKKTTKAAAAAKDNQQLTDSNTPAGAQVNRATDEPTRASLTFNQTAQDMSSKELCSENTKTQEVTDNNIRSTGLAGVDDGEKGKKVSKKGQDQTAYPNKDHPFSTPQKERILRNPNGHAEAVDSYRYAQGLDALTEEEKSFLKDPTISLRIKIDRYPELAISGATAEDETKTEEERVIAEQDKALEY